MTVQQKTTAEKRAPSALRPVTQLVRPLIKGILPQKSVIFQQLFDLWPEIVAGTEAANAVPEKLVFQRQQQKDACLCVWAQSSVQATEMTYNRRQLMQRINSVFGYSLVADIKVTAFPGIGLPKKATPAKVNSAKGISSQSLDKALAGISNPSLRQTLMELGGVLDAEPTVQADDNDTQKGNTHE